MTASAIRAKHSPAGMYRVSQKQFEKGTRFSGSMRAGRCYVLDGQCCYKYEGAEVMVRTNEYVDLDAGQYEFKVPGDTDVVVIKVWKISDQ